VPLATRAAAAIIAALAMAGCGGGGEEKGPSPRAVVESFAKAFGAGDGERACDLLTKAAQKAFIARVQPLTGADDCPAAIEKLVDAAGGSVSKAYASAKVDQVKISGSKATATLTAEGGATTVALAKEDGDWRLTGVPGL
jgi:hypothetical protein